MKIMITEEGKKPYVAEVSEKIGKKYLAKENPRFKYELFKEISEEPKVKNELQSKLEKIKKDKESK